jgi:hypothetical protein
MARKRQSSAVTRPIVLVLCAALFTWGLQSKLSSYKAPNQSHTKSVVRLLQDDQSRRLAASGPVAPRSPFLRIADLVAVYSQPRLIVSRTQQVRRSAPDSAASRSYSLHFRPPPSTI